MAANGTDGPGKQHVHIVVDAELWKQFKIEAIKNDETMTSLLEKMLKELTGAGDEEAEEVESKGGLKGGSVLTLKTPNADNGGSNGSSLVAATLTAGQRQKALGIVHPQPPKPYAKYPHDRIKEIYNQVARESKTEGLPGFCTCRRLDTTRKRGMDRLSKALGESLPAERLLTSNVFMAYFRKCLRNRHWCGGNDRGWRADIEFLTRDTTISKAMEIEDVFIAPKKEPIDPSVAIEKAKSMARQWVETGESPSTDFDAYRASVELFLKQNGLSSEYENLVNYYKEYRTYFASTGAST